MMKVKLKSYLGKILFIIGSCLFLILFFVRKSHNNLSYNIFDIAIPEPPLWTSYIPIVGDVILWFYELFSINGLLVLISALIAVFGYQLSNSKNSIIQI